MKTPNKPTDTVQVTTGPYISVKNVILEKLKPASITRKRYEEVTTKAVSYCTKKYSEEGYSFKLCKTELLTWVKLCTYSFLCVWIVTNINQSATTSSQESDHRATRRRLQQLPKLKPTLLVPQRLWIWHLDLSMVARLSLQEISQWWTKVNRWP